METIYTVLLTTIICVIVFVLLYKKNEKFRLSLELFGKEPSEIVAFVQERGSGNFDFSTLNWIFKKVLGKLHTIDPDSAVACVNWHVSESLKDRLCRHLLTNRKCVDCLVKHKLLIPVLNKVLGMSEKEDLLEEFSGNLIEIAMDGPVYASMDQISESLETLFGMELEFSVPVRKLVAMILIPHFGALLRERTWDFIYDIFGRNESVSRMRDTFRSEEHQLISSS